MNATSSNYQDQPIASYTQSGGTSSEVHCNSQKGSLACHAMGCCPINIPHSCTRRFKSIDIMDVLSGKRSLPSSDLITSFATFDQSLFSDLAFLHTHILDLSDPQTSQAQREVMIWKWARSARQSSTSPAPSTEVDGPTPVAPQSQSSGYTDAKSALQAILASSDSTSPTSPSTLIPNSTNSSASWSSANSPLNSGSGQIWHLDRQSGNLRTQADSSERLLASTTEALKEFGDLQTWAEVVWRDIFVLEEVFALVDSGMLDAEEAAMRVGEAIVR